MPRSVAEKLQILNYAIIPAEAQGGLLVNLPEFFLRSIFEMIGAQSAGRLVTLSKTHIKVLSENTFWKSFKTQRCKSR